MFEAEYLLWRGALVYTNHLLKDQYYDEFSESCLMPPFSIVVCTLSLPCGDTSSEFLYPKYQPTVAEYKDLVWLVGNLKLQVRIF